MIDDKAERWLYRAMAIGLVVAWICVLFFTSGCGLLNAGMASAGVPGAATPEAQQAAQNADSAAWNWLGTALFGVGTAAAGAGATHRAHKRKAKRAAHAAAAAAVPS